MESFTSSATSFLHNATTIVLASIRCIENNSQILHLSGTGLSGSSYFGNILHVKSKNTIGIVSEVMRNRLSLQSFEFE